MWQQIKRKVISTVNTMPHGLETEGSEAEDERSICSFNNMTLVK